MVEVRGLQKRQGSSWGLKCYRWRNQGGIGNESTLVTGEGRREANVWRQGDGEWRYNKVFQSNALRVRGYGNCICGRHREAVVWSGFAFVLDAPWGSAMAQAWLATASVAITPKPLFYIGTSLEWAALQKWSPWSMESSSPWRKIRSPRPQGVIYYSIRESKRKAPLLLPFS